jgi:hypothetical protein
MSDERGGWLDATMKRLPRDGQSSAYYDGWREGLRWRVHHAQNLAQSLLAAWGEELSKLRAKRRENEEA